MTERDEINENQTDALDEGEIHLEVVHNTAKWMMSNGLANTLFEAIIQISEPKRLGEFLRDNFSSPEEAYNKLFTNK